MRFDEDIHWSEWLFLAPLHLLYLQRAQAGKLMRERSFSLPFPCGLLDLEIDEDALRGGRVVLRRFSAVMPAGETVSMPGNAVVSPLDVTPELESHVQSFTVYLALPSWSDCDANVASDAGGRRQFVCHDVQARDENTGDNEITLTTRRYNTQLTTDRRDNTDMELLPIAVITAGGTGADGIAQPVISRTFIPPFLMVTRDCQLASMTEELLVQLRKRRDKILLDLTSSGFSTQNMDSSTLYSLLQLRTLNSGEARLSLQLSSGFLTPFGLYLELRSLLGEFSALYSQREAIDDVDFNHMNCYPQFDEAFTELRSLIMSEGVSSYISLPFEAVDGGHFRRLALKDDHLLKADEYYLAVQCDGDPRRIAGAIELGDNIKVVNPGSVGSRTRGVKLVEMRYPPRFLPALQDTIWFRLDRKESPRIWSDICAERAMLLDWAEEVFPNLKATVYITTLTKEE
ncbi:MAG: type VI secretion system baseplate subunit TssK [Victivallaceae bacterium]|nr:type VI secretion system baseplate subunit TssK [Victivallaceae bacterium]